VVAIADGLPGVRRCETAPGRDPRVRKECARRVTEFFADLSPETRSTPVALWTRRAVLTVFAVFVLLALLDRFGQRTSESVAVAPAASLRVNAPETLRGGLLFQSRIEIRALRDVKLPRIVLDRGWMEGMQINSIEPAAMSESSRSGRVVLSYDQLAAGDLLRIYLSFQVNPTYIGRLSYGVDLDDGTTRIARVNRTLTVLP
jgi:hypothetical protein